MDRARETEPEGWASVEQNKVSVEERNMNYGVTMMNLAFGTLRQMATLLHGPSKELQNCPRQTGSE